MALAFSSYDRMERILLKTRQVLGEGDPTLNEDNKVQALQLAASLYNLYGGDGSETDYEDDPSTTILQSELIATAAAKDLTLSAISYYKDDVIDAQGGPASAKFRLDKLAWLQTLLKELEAKLNKLEQALGMNDEEGLMPGLALGKLLGCCDPVEDRCEPEIAGAFKEVI